MRSFVLLALLVACAEAPDNKAPMASSGSGSNANVDATNPHTDAAPPEGNAQEGQNKNLAPVAESEKVTAPSQINGALLSCKIDDKRIDDGVAVDCLLVDAEKKPLLPSALGLDVAYSFQAAGDKPIKASVDVQPNDNDNGVSYIFKAGDSKKALADVPLANFKATLTVKTDVKISGDLITPGKDVLSTFIKDMFDSTSSSITDSIGKGFSGRSKDDGKED